MMSVLTLTDVTYKYEGTKKNVLKKVSPDVIIADEPTGNLDTDTEDDVSKILTSLVRDEGKCVIIVTHSKKVSSVADEVLGMKDGNLTFVKQGHQGR